jgi:SAM-dependent methyltransferase
MKSGTATIQYGHFCAFEGWEGFPAFVQKIVTTFAVKRVCEFGPGPNPSLSVADIKRLDLTYVGVEAERREIGKSAGIGLVCGDVCAGCDIPGGPFDLVIARMVGEHFCDPRRAYENAARFLKSGGLCVSSFATLFALPFCINRLLPEPLLRSILRAVAPRNEEAHDKFRAYYKRCRGPSTSQFRFFDKCGFDVIEYRAYFGHNYYRSRMPYLVRALHTLKTIWLLKHPIAHLSSYATVVLRKR